MYHEFGHHIHQMKYVLNNPSNYSWRYVPLIRWRKTKQLIRDERKKVKFVKDLLLF